MATTNWDFDFAHSNVGFTVRHLLVSKVRGRFAKWGGSVRYDPQNPAASSVDVRILFLAVGAHVGYATFDAQPTPPQWVFAGLDGTVVF